MKLDRDDSVATPRARQVGDGFGNGSDQQIIDAIVSEGHVLLRELSQRGVSSEAVRARAGQIGLTKEFIRRCRLSGSRPAMRVCMKCDAHFLSAGKHNRLCRRCARV